MLPGPDDLIGPIASAIHGESAEPGRERRLNLRLVEYWMSLRKGESFPDPDDFDTSAVKGFPKHGLVLEFGEGYLDPVFRFAGSAICEDNGSDLNGQNMSVAGRSSLVAQVTDHYLQVIANRAPITFEARFDNARGVPTLYRSVLLPLAADGQTVSAVVGAINCRERPDLRQSGDMVGPTDGKGAPDPESVLRFPVPGGDLSKALSSGLPQTDSPPLSGPVPGDSGDTALHDALARCRTKARDADTADRRSHDALYEALAETYRFAPECEATPAGFKVLLGEAGIRPRRGAFLTSLVRLVFGTRIDRTRVSQYAAALAWGRRNDVAPLDFRDFLGTHPDGLKGCVRCERTARREDRGESGTPALDVRDLLRDATALGTIDDPGGTEEFLLLLGRRRNGRIDIVAGLDRGGKAPPDSVLRRAARNLKPDPADS